MPSVVLSLFGHPGTPQTKWFPRPACACGEILALRVAVVQRGQPPQVHREKDSITIVMAVTVVTGDPPVRLVVRCERDGDIFVSFDGRASRDPA